MSVYILTRNRHENLRKVIPFWLEQDIPVTLIVERSEVPGHRALVREMGWGMDVNVASPAKPERGIGYARNFAVRHAYEQGLRSFIMSDDDVRPAKGSDMRPLLREARRPGVLGIGAVRQIHDFFTGGAISANSGLIICPSGWGLQMFALNTAMTRNVGNYDPKLDCLNEDGELVRQGIARGIPWLVHTDVHIDPLGKRYDPGGLNSYAGTSERRKARELACHRIVYARWPKYISAPPKALRTSWGRMMDDFIPGWRKRSAIHGGKW